MDRGRDRYGEGGTETEEVLIDKWSDGDTEMQAKWQTKDRVVEAAKLGLSLKPEASLWLLVLQPGQRPKAIYDRTNRF
eukprot:scaffold626203_cov37-Prasinocladus_malaysianus.AAC.1